MMGRRRTSAASGKPSIAVLTASLSPLAGGMYYSIRIPAIRASQIGYPTLVLGLADRLWPEAKPHWHVDVVAAERIYGPKRFGFSPLMYNSLNAFHPDIVHLHGIWNFPSFVAWQWQRRTKRPLVISPHGMLDAGALKFSPRLKGFVAALFERDNLQRATVLHALNRDEADAFRDYGLTNPIAIIPNGVDVTPLSTAPKPSAGGAPRTLLFLGRIHPKKGIDHLLRAWAAARTRDPAAANGWRLVIAGWDDGHNLDGLRAQASALGLGDVVSFPGPLHGADKEAALDAADAFILPSHSEGLPMTVLEAWARALPVLMTAACNLPDGFSEGAAERVVLEPDAFADTLSALFARSPEALAEMGRMGRDLVERRYTWEAIVGRFGALYDWIAGQAAVPDFVEFARKEAA